MNLSKYVAEDVPLFLSLISDLFPGISAEKSKHTVVEKALSDTIPQYDLLPHPAWYEKIIQVHPTLTLTLTLTPTPTLTLTLTLTVTPTATPTPTPTLTLALTLTLTLSRCTRWPSCGIRS